MMTYVSLLEPEDLLGTLDCDDICEFIGARIPAGDTRL